MIALGYLGALLTGVSLGLIGGGGSILIVPVLVYLFGIHPALATAYSLFIVGMTAVVGAYSYGKMKLIDYHTGFYFALPSFLGVFVARRFVIPSLPEEILQWQGVVLDKDALIMLVFALVMLAASYAMITRRAPEESKASKVKLRPAIKNTIIAGEGLVIGFITGFVGAGGGFLIIPALVILAGLPMKMAVGTSLVIIAAKSLIGFLGDVSVGQQISWGFLLVVTAISISGIFVGTKISRHVSGSKLQPAFGWFVLIMAVVILAQSLL